MPKFMVIIKEDEARERRLPPSETKALVEGHSTYERALREADAYVDGERFRPSIEGRRVATRDGDPHVEAGPFPGKVMSGYYVLAAESLDRAVKLAGECPMPPGAELDVRPLMKSSLRPGKTGERGRVFAFTVVAGAADERTWIDVMDRIDAATQDEISRRALPGRRPPRGAGAWPSSRRHRRSSSDLRWPVPREQGGHRRRVLRAHGEPGGGRGVGVWDVVREVRRAGDPRAVAELSETLGETVRREKSRVVGVLVRTLGGIDAAEEAFQEAVLAALSSWRDGRIPANPAAWLTTTAKNYARDAARHARIVDRRAPLLAETDMTQPATLEAVDDDELRLIFTCCHPALTLDSQVALTLKVVAGFTTEEIARAFLCPEKTIAQRIVRAKRTIADQRIPYAVPERAELPERLASVLAVVYLVFNEGHTTRDGPLMRLDLQTEALRLGHALCNLLPGEPEVFALLALMAFSFARAATRTDEQGELLLLFEQDRSRWDGPTIKEGLMALERARRLGGRGAYVLQAEIAACHATSSTWETTDWSRILDCYDALLALTPSPVVALNRAVAVCMQRGVAEGLAALAPLETSLASYHLFYAIRADFRRRLGQDARDDYRRALELAGNESERRFLRRRIDESS